MKHRALFSVIACIGFLVGHLAAKDALSQFKQVQVKHFTQANGVGLSQDFINYFYDGLRARLQKENLAGQVVDEAATVPAAEAADSIVIEGKFTDYDQGNAFLRPASVGVEIKLYRVSDHQLITILTPKLISKRSNDKNVAEFTSSNAAKEIKKTAKNLPSLASFPPFTPVQASTPTAAAPVSQTPAPDALTSSSVLEMIAAKLPEEVIIAKIQTSPTNFDSSTAALADLNQKGVSSAIIKAMLMAPKAAPAPVGSPGMGVDTHSPDTLPVRHYTIAEGVSFPAQINPQDYLELFPGELRARLEKRRVPVQVVAEGGSAADAGAGSIVVEGIVVTGVSKGNGSMANPVIITIETGLYRGGDHTLIKSVTSKIKAIGGPHGSRTPLYDAKNLATWTADWVGDDIKKALK